MSGAVLDPLDADQRARVAALYEVTRNILPEESMPETVCPIAHYIVTGQLPPAVAA